MPGWHTTIFPPYFVIGAIFSGFAMVITLMTFMRGYFGMKNYITLNHMESMAKILMLTGMLVGFAYSTEFFMAWYSGSEWEGFIFKNRAFGPYGWAYAIMFTCNAIVPQVFWFKKMRRHTWVLFVVSILVNVGMWFERYVIVVTSLHRDFLPSSWGMYALTRWDYAILVGSFGLFFTLFLLFVRFLPVVAISEVKGVMDPKVARSAPTDAAAAAAHAGGLSHDADLDQRRPRPLLRAGRRPGRRREGPRRRLEALRLPDPVPDPRHGRGDGPEAVVDPLGDGRPRRSAASSSRRASRTT